ncbi:hypothetical protein M3P05_09105 [Sansalvadorimonas sp. 2012CJ34-2]|uniref:Uncharacterized protein n=1 Tax=Parendozoicomonas callyspongiae TaxID=2942213 RepID=A0ABT0PFD8_9GAMM|nr:hypothetical protein [Sansalvadorimonas sp. 2012CJ34-2]MCL6270089.1 hypothetical protein [Sansalvadorimonas sp. 2012CJ34-2]
MGDEPLLPLNIHKHSRVRAAIAQTPVATANRRQREIIAEMWPEISFRKKEKLLGFLLGRLRRHFRSNLNVSLVRHDDDVRFLLEDSETHTVHQLTLEDACKVLERDSDHNGQLLNQEC